MVKRLYAMVIFFEIAREMGRIEHREGSQKEAGPVTAICVYRRVVVGEKLRDRKGGLTRKSAGGRGRKRVKLCLGGTAW